MLTTGQTLSAVALVLEAMAVGCTIAMHLGYRKNRYFYRQLVDFSENPINARVLAELLDEPKGSIQAKIAYWALVAQGRVS